jgi:hypothetical protein
MASVMAIVSKVVFEKAHGRDVRPGAVLPFDGYDSQHASLAAGGDLYLVTVRPGDVLWLVGVLRGPRSTGKRWAAARSAAPVADASRVVGKLRFQNGAGVSTAPGKLGMSLQTPRAATAGATPCSTGTTTSTTSS